VRPSAGRYLAKQYARKVRRYFANAKRLAKEEHGESVDKAGEIVWGAAVLAIKTVAATKGQELRKSTDVMRYVEERMSDHDQTMLNQALALHASFYGLERSNFDFILRETEAWVNDLFSDYGIERKR